MKNTLTESLDSRLLKYPIAASGKYFYGLETNGYVSTKKMILLK